MKTTELIVELLVIGMGTLISLSLIIYLFTLETNFDHSFKIPAFYIFPALVLSYVFGILTDRVSDFLYAKVERAMRKKRLGNDGANTFQQIRTLVNDSSPSLYNWFIYSRSRIRIVRGWSVSFFVMSITLLIYYVKNDAFSNVLLYLLITCIACSFLSIFSYHRLLRSEYRRLKNAYDDMIINNDKQTQPSSFTVSMTECLDAEFKITSK